MAKLFGPKPPQPRKSAGLRKKGIMEKSRRDLQTTMLYMTNKVNCNAENRRGSFGSGRTNIYRQEDINVRQLSPLMMSDYAPLAKSAPIALKGMKQTSTLDTRQPLIYSEKGIISSHLRSEDDSNAIVGCQKQSQILNIKEGTVHNSNGTESSLPTHLKAMAGLVRKENIVDRLNRFNNGLPTRAKDLLVLKKGESNEDERSHGEFMIDNNHKQVHAAKAKRILGNNSDRMFGRDLSNFQKDKTSYLKENDYAISSANSVEQTEFMETNLEQHTGGQLSNCDGKMNNGKSKRRREPFLEGKSKRRREPFLEGKLKKNDDNHSEIVVQQENQTCRPMKKSRRRKVIFEDEDESVDVIGDQNCVSAEDDTARSTSQATILKNYHVKVPISLCIKKQCYCCSKPIDDPTWRGIFKIGGKMYVSLSGHLSTKCGEKVQQLSRSLLPVVEVTKLSRSEVWPKRWEASKPNANNIGLYFLPHEMSPNEDLDQLVTEVMENDLVLRAVVGDAEMLIFPSILLPERYQTFQMKHYLWGVFKSREDKGVAAAEILNDVEHCAQEVEKEAHHVSNPRDEIQCEVMRQETISMKSSIPLEDQWLSAKSTQEVVASMPPNMGLEPNAPEEGGQGDSLGHVHAAEAMTANDAGTLYANHAQTAPSMGHPPGKIFGFVVRETPRVTQLIREMEREGAVLVAMQGETMGAGSWLGNFATDM